MLYSTTYLYGGVIITIYQKLLAQSKQLTNQINSLRTQISNLPPGKLICTRNGNKFKWYQSLPQKLVYIPRKSKKLAEDLAYKKYLSLKLDELIAEQECLSSCITYYSSCSSKSDELLTSSSEYSRLLRPAFQVESETLQDWAQASYERNLSYPEDLTFKTSLGFCVRSKSEALIAMMLHQYKIPFHYEEKLVLDGHEFYPDFTIRHPRTGEYYYLEHLGLLDDPKYSKRNFSKLEYYNSHGLIMNQNLIITSETRDHPLDIELVEKLIKHFFLD